MKISWSWYLVILLISAACQQETRLKPHEGYVNVTGGEVWYKIAGEGDKIPIILLHGGPGIPSYYLNPLTALGGDRPVILYDQLGCGRSYAELDTSLMTVESFVTQLEELRSVLGIEKFYLYGSSWGTMLGIDYYLKYPERVKAIIFSSPCLSAKRWSADADTLIATLPDSIQQAIRINSENGTYSSPGYIRAAGVYMQKFVLRNPSPDTDSAFAKMNLKLYEYMWGPSEFTALGTLKDYDRTGRLGEVKVPALFIAGEFDEARPATVQYYQSLVPGSSFALTKNAAHLTMQDNPTEDIRVIRDFLDRLEKK